MKTRILLLLGALVVAAPAQTLFSISTHFGSNVRAYDSQSGSVLSASLVSGVSDLTAIAVDGSGYLYLNNYSAGTIGKYDASTGAVVDAAFVTGFNTAGHYTSSLAVDSTGRLYVGAGSGIYAYDSVTGASLGGPIIPSNVGSYILATDSADNLYIANPTAISKYDATGALLADSYVTGLSFLHDLAIYNGSIFVSTGTGGTIQTFDAGTGQLLDATFISGLGNARSVAVDNDRLYIATDSAIAVYNATTGALIDASLVDSGASQLTMVITPIPEPSTYALLLGILGLAAVGWRRCRK